MDKKMGWLLMILAVFVSMMIMTTGCFSSSKEEVAVEPEHEDSEHDITLTIDGNSFIPDVTRSIHFDYMNGITVKDALLTSNIISFNEKGTAIQSVGAVSLDASLAWGVKLNQSKLDAAKWNTALKVGDEIQVYVMPVLASTDTSTAGSLVMAVDGGIHKPELRRYFVTRFQDSVTVRDLLIISGMVQLTANYKEIVSVNGYHCDPTERWVLKVNKKALIEAGLDMRLSSNDVVEIQLVKY